MNSVSFVIPGVEVGHGFALNYCAKTGIFYWAKSSTRIRVGDVAGGKDRKGYIRIRVGSKKIAAHRLAWLATTGEDPGAMSIDHINGDKTDNRIENLRLATNAENQRNKGGYKCKPDLPKGVFWNKAKGRFHAAIRFNGKLNHLGYFDVVEKAKAAYAEAAKRLHGEFMNLGSQA